MPIHLPSRIAKALRYKIALTSLTATPQLDSLTTVLPRKVSISLVAVHRLCLLSLGAKRTWDRFGNAELAILPTR